MNFKARFKRLKRFLLMVFGLHPRTRIPSSSCTLLIWVPTYDLLTQHMSLWIEDLEVPTNVVPVSIIGGTVTKESVQESLLGIKVKPAITLFLGHGCKHALLGAPQGTLTDILINGSEHAPIYEQDMFDKGPDAIFAFCCSAGSGLGPDFADRSGGAFLGYDDEIPLNLMDEVCDASWKRIVHGITAQLMGHGTILPEDEQYLRSLYESEFHYFRDGDGRRNEQSVLMQMYLLRQRNLISYERG